jgi:outer membrane immunogenic protein
MKQFWLGSAAFFLLSAGAALAADMPAKAPVYKAQEPVYDWSGLYVGVYSGVGVQRSRGFDPTGAIVGTVEYTGMGFTGGGTVGYNWQFNRNWVVGIEGDFGHLGLSHTVQDYNDSLLYNSKTSWIGTLRGRAGYSNGPTLNYVTGGGAWVHADDSIVSLSRGGSDASSKTLGGHTIGSGVETMLGGNWTAKAETSFVDVGRGTTLGPSANNGFILTDKHRYETMKFGLNYLFGGKQPVLMAHNWNGFYAGVVGGTAVTESRGNGPGPFLAAGNQIGNNGDGLTIGGQAGYNWQFAPSWVAGVEGDFSYLGIKHTNANYNDPTALLGIKTSWLGTARGRLGYSTGPALLYVTGGAAWVHLQDQWAFTTPTSSSITKSGSTIGGGIETVLSGNWTSKTEYLFVDAGKGNTLVSAGNSMQVDHKFHVFRSALIYQFGSSDWGKAPISAKY